MKSVIFYSSLAVSLVLTGCLGEKTTPVFSWMDGAKGSAVTAKTAPVPVAAAEENVNFAPASNAETGAISNEPVAKVVPPVVLPPVAVNPPVVQPPAAVNPPAAQPPAAVNPPVVQPPAAVNPPAAQPPVAEKPAETPAEQPPAVQPPVAEQPPVVPTVDKPLCAEEAAIAPVVAGAQFKMRCTTPAGEQITVVLRPEAGAPTDAGSLLISNSGDAVFNVLYMAPSQPQSFVVHVWAVNLADASDQAHLGVLSVQGAQEIAVVKDEQAKQTSGFSCKVFDFRGSSLANVDIDSLPTLQMIMMANLDIPTRAFTAGIPGVYQVRNGVEEKLIEYFGMYCTAYIDIAAAGKYIFKLSADDGALLYLDDAVVINNDGVHATQSKSSSSLNLTKGRHKIAVKYFQGPRYHIALQLFMKQDNSSASFAIVPASMIFQ